MPQRIADVEQSMAKVKSIKPNPGPQEQFLATNADIAIFGGAAGGGKSYSLLMESLRYVGVRGYECAIFRREATQITSGGGLWDTAHILYPAFGGEPRTTPRHFWTFPAGSKIAFAHLQHDKSVKAWDGAQLTLVGFDELQHFTEAQFFYMLSRNRSTCGVRSYMRATCNPDPDSFLVKLLAWWIDEEGYPIPERSGVVRWFIRQNGELIWFNSYDECYALYHKEIDSGDASPKSFTFIRSTLEDNPALMELDKGYKGNLNSMFEYERLRLLKGNWFARPQAGEMFKTGYWKYIDRDDMPRIDKMKGIVRYWDRAGTLPSDKNPDPDWTAGCYMMLSPDDNLYIYDMRHARLEPHDVEMLVKDTAEQDTREVPIWLERDPGQAGKAEVAYYIRNLMGYDLHQRQKRTSKLSYWRPFASQVKAGNVYLVRAPWNRTFVDELASVTDGSQTTHDDQADAASGAFMVLAKMMKDDISDSKAMKNMGV